MDNNTQSVNQSNAHMSAHEIELKVMLDLAFSDMKSAEITKKQYCDKGRKVFLPILAALATVIYVVFMIFTSIITIYYRVVLMPIETLVWLFFVLRFAMSFYVDICTKKHAEKISLVTDESGKKYFYGEGNHVKKFEYDGGNIVAWGKGEYEKFTDKSKYNPLASRYDKHLQRRSSNLSVISADFLFEKIRAGSFTVTDGGIHGESESGSFSIKFDDKYIKSIYFVGKADIFYDSVSPIHIFDCFLPFNYTFSYKFDKINELNTIEVPSVINTAIKDYLLPEVSSEVIKFL